MTAKSTGARRLKPIVTEKKVKEATAFSKRKSDMMASSRSQYAFCRIDGAENLSRFA
jgi:hypothetical protein